MKDEDARVIDKARWSSSGISAIDVATASLGHLEPTRSNLFRLKRKDAA